MSRKPGRLRLWHGRDGQLWAERGERTSPVVVHRCFPWSAPSSHISLRNPDEEEFAHVRDLSLLDARSRTALLETLAVAGFVLEITAIEEVAEEVEIRRWAVQTRQGPRRFQTRLDEWPADVAGGGVLIRDVAGDLYHVPDPAALDEASRGWLWTYAG
ncbi:MAG: DUF1854 domain-containing protein [Gemmatimonadetes bacterium]|nr:DUF1854 domain-containing protein [Gemmatimonadota bacterium]MYE16250.1 DUF1854 domain-containing protein [Gemmatimonadota bacterium]